MKKTLDCIGGGIPKDLSEFNFISICSEKKLNNQTKKEIVSPSTLSQWDRVDAVEASVTLRVTDHIN